MPKQLIPVGGRSVLARVLDDIVSCGIDEIAVVTSPEAAGPIRSMLAADSRLPVEPEILIQPEPNGLAAAYGVALPFLDGAPSLLYLGDCLVTGGVQHVIDKANSTGAEASILVAEVDDPSRYGIVELAGDGTITRLVEKPSEPPSDLAVVGVYVFARPMDEVIAAVEPSWRGEYEITDALQLIVDGGGRIMPSRLEGWWIDTGTVPDVLRAQSLLLGDLGHRVDGAIESSDLTGAIRVERDAVIRDSVLVGPVIVEAGAVVAGSRIGPSTTIGARTVVREANVSGSILMEDVSVRNVGLEDSILGPRATIEGTGLHPSLSVVAGADAVVSSARSSHSG